MIGEKAETENLRENEMGTLPIGKLLRKMSLPLIFSMFVQVLYGLVDSMYVAQLGDTALTAISLCMPVQYLVLGVGIGIGVGVNSILSKKLGEKDEHGVNRAAGNGFVLIWIVSVVFVIMGLFAMEPFYGLQTDIAEVLDMSISYSRIISIVSFAALHQVIMERLLSATGKANLTMIPMLTGAVVNIVLDPVMIFGWFGLPALGIAVPDFRDCFWNEQYSAFAFGAGPRNLCHLYPFAELCNYALRRHEHSRNFHHCL